MKQERSYGAIIISLHPEWWGADESRGKAA